jgi:hypothetical protein
MIKIMKYREKEEINLQFRLWVDAHKIVELISAVMYNFKEKIIYN